MDDSQNVVLIKRMYALFAEKNFEEIRHVLDENIRWNQMKGFPGGGQYVGVENVLLNVFGGFNRNWTIWTASISRYIDTGDGVFVIGAYEGIYAGTGRHMRAEFACEYKVQGGLIAEFNQYTDTFLIADAMGLVGTDVNV